MSERWRYQIKFGIFLAICISFFYSFFMNENQFFEQIKSKQFYIWVLLQLISGIFIGGYISWKMNDKKKNSWNSWNSWSELFKKLDLKKVYLKISLVHEL